MNNSKISFIYCVNDERQYSESAKSIDSLLVPEGFIIDKLAVAEAEGIANGYNYAMNHSDAKYKVYLHQDTLIINNHFIFDILELFQTYPKLGLLGMVGAHTLPTNGIWWEARQKFGKVYESHTGTMELLAFQEVQSDYVQVTGIDGFMMITQYDLPWREDLLKGWHFYDLSQSAEFMKAGYEVGVPKQEDPWCIHDCGVINVRNGFDDNRVIFLEEYSKQLFPLVSVMIPTYNRPRYFELALKSALEQTYKNIEIIVCDDSTNDETQQLIQPYLKTYKHIRYYKNEQNLGQFQNDVKCMELATGEYVNFLMDDDLFHSQKIERMMNYFLHFSDMNVSLVTSHRQLIDAHGNFLQDIRSTSKLFNENKLIDGYEFGSFMLSVPCNYIGEPTTALFRKSDLEEPFGTFLGREYGCNVDMAAWIKLLSKGNIVYISDSLSYFRIHGEQQQQSEKMLVAGIHDYVHQILNAPQLGFFTNKAQYVKAIGNCLKYMSDIVNGIGEEYRRNSVFQQIAHFQQLLTNEQLLVSVLIPAYNRPHYLELALQSVLNQTYKNIEIIICDDSSNDEVQQMIQPYLNIYKNLQYHKNDKNLNGYYNLIKLMNLAKGFFINFLCDDDLFHNKKIEKMVDYLINYEDVTLVTSYRKLIDETGAELEDTSINRALFDRDTKIEGKQLGDFILSNMFNAIGEPTSPMFRKADLIEGFGVYKGFEYNQCIVDVSTWITLLSRGKAIYIREPLSYFRQHSLQNQKKAHIYLGNIPEWIQLIEDSREDGFLSNEHNYKMALETYLQTSRYLINEAIAAQKEELLLEMNIYEYCNRAVKNLIRISDKYSCPYCNSQYNHFLPWPDKFDFPNYKFEMYNKHSALCSSCYSMDRERLYKLFIEKETNLLNSNSRILHVAPEKNMRQWLMSLNKFDYISADLFPQDLFTEKMDITEIQYPDESFDVIFCSHVLEHIPDDMKAMAELYRVLRIGGWGIIQVPIAINISETFEDFSITTPEERYRIFGQDDHVRIYARDYIDRLISVGFRVEVYNYATKYGVTEAAKFGLSETDNLYVVYKMK